MAEKQKQRPGWATALIVSVTLAVFVLSLPYLFTHPVVQNQIKIFLTNNINGTTTFQGTSLTLLPRPAIHIRQVRSITANGVFLFADSVTLFPRLSSFFAGKFQIDRILVARPDIAYVPSQGNDTTPLSLSPTIETIRKHLSNWYGMLSAVADDALTIEINGGTLSVTKSGTLLLTCGEISGRLLWQHPVLSAEFSAKGSLWKDMVATSSINLSQNTGSGTISVKECNPAPMAAIFFPKASVQLDHGTLTATIDWKTGEFETMEVSCGIEHPDLSFHNAKQVQRIQGNAAAGKIVLRKNGFHVDVTKLDLSSPALWLSGDLDLNRDLPKVAWHANAREVDLSAVRIAALFFANRFNATREIFDIFESGKIPQMALSQEAQTPSDLKDASTLVLAASLEKAEVNLKGANLRLEDTTGKIKVSGGILEATEVTTHLGNTTGSNGSFTMQLTGSGSKPFHVDGEVAADLSELPPILSRLTGKGTLSAEMKKVRAPKGNAVGRLVLDRKDDHLTVMVDVSDVTLSAGYDRSPYPINITGGAFRYRSGNVGLGKLQGTIGDTRFSDVDADISWTDGDTFLRITSSRVDMSVDETAAWLNTYSALGRVMNQIQPAGGRLKLRSLQLEGPAQRPSEWRFDAEGEVVAPVTFIIPMFPERTAIHQGRFIATQDRLEVSDTDVAVMDAKLRIEGVWKGYLSNRPPLDIRMAGRIGRKAGEWILRRTKSLSAFQWCTPITLASGTFLWEGGDRIAVSAHIIETDRPEIIINMHSTPDQVSVDRLRIQSAEDSAEATLLWNRDMLSFQFSGALKHNTLRALPVKISWSPGSLSGDFRATYRHQASLTSSMTGHLRVEGLDLSSEGLPLVISQLSLTAQDTSASISSAHFSWNGIPFVTTGRISRIEKGVLLDSSLTCDTLDWNQLKTLIKSFTPSDHASPSFLFGTVRVSCTEFTLAPAIVIAPLMVDLNLNGSEKEFTITTANTCGISFPGKITIAPDQTRFEFHPNATDQELKPAIACLWKGETTIDGRFNLAGNISFEPKENRPVTELIEGPLSLTASDGRIYRAAILGKIFSFLNITEIVSGRLPDLEKEGVYYSTAAFDCEFKNGSLELRSGVIDSQAMKLFFQGNEDIVNRSHNLTIVVAPLKTVDRIISKIPLLKNVLKKGGVIYPIKMSGSWDKPEVTLLSPAAVGKEVWGVMTRVLSLPVTILEKMVPSSTSSPP